MTVAALRRVEAPLDCRDEWQRALDEFGDSDSDLEVSRQETADTGLGRKRPDGVAFHWGRKTVLVLEFTRAYDWRADWFEVTDRAKTERYTPLRDKLAHCLGSSWTVQVLVFTLGVRGSYYEPVWRTTLEQFGLGSDEATKLMTELVTNCLAELDELYNVRSAALRRQRDHG
jgi:hypothetical protein